MLRALQELPRTPLGILLFSLTQTAMT